MESINSTSITNFKVYDPSYISFLDQSRKINIILTIVIILVGLIGNFLTIFVFSQKKFKCFRSNSSHIYLMSLAANDSLFLFVHFFEDTIRTLSKFFIYFIDALLYRMYFISKRTSILFHFSISTFK
jgi:hypothetical protein